MRRAGDYQRFVAPSPRVRLDSVPFHSQYTEAHAKELEAPYEIWLCAHQLRFRKGNIEPHVNFLQEALHVGRP